MKKYADDVHALWDHLLPLIADGASLPQAVATLPEPRPSLTWFKESVRRHPDLEARYRQAQEDRADALAERIVSVAEELIPAGLTGPEASAWAQRQRLRVDSLRWTASKLRPRFWGEHVQVDVAVDARISITAALAAAERRVAMITEEPARVLEPEGVARARLSR
jgi:hypothetical protein